MTTLDFDQFDVLTFDCYGTLIDWETGILRALRPILDAHDVTASDEQLLEAFARHEAVIEAGPYRRYREVLAECLDRIGAEFGLAPTDAEREAFAGSVSDWPAFADSPAALRRLTQRFKLAVITNCDDDLFARSAARLGIGFDWVVTAEQVGTYKPSHRNFEHAFESIEAPRERILHVAQSLFHDHVPAKELGLSSVWIDRRHGADGFGATPPASAEPDLAVPDLASLAAVAVAS
jgi:2-haloacid dehalogenase